MTHVARKVAASADAPVEAPRLYFSGRACYGDMLADIERAQREISLEMYIFASDAVGRQFVEALIRQAQAGRRVRVIYDALGCFDYAGGFYDEMRRGGVAVKQFNPIQGARLFRNRPTIDRRNHRKLLVVDDRIVYTGGVNISQFVADWEDAHVRLAGPIGRRAQRSFEQVWNGEYPRVAVRRGGRAWLHKERTVLLDGFPAPNFSQIKQAYLHLFARARRRICLAHAYFIPDRRVIRALRRAVQRGVNVSVLVPRHSDVGFADWALRHVLVRLLRGGVEVRMLASPMLHAKAAIADDRYAIIGSANLNRNSFFRNLEIAVWTRDDRLVRPMRERFDALWPTADAYTLADHRRRSLGRRLRSWAAYNVQSLAPINQPW